MFGNVHCGDCVAGLNACDPGWVDLVFADPPFNIGYEYDVYDDRKTADEYLQWSRTWLEAVYRAIKPDGTFWLAIGDEFAAELRMLCRQVGFLPRSWVIWYYTFGVNNSRNFSRSHTHLMYFTKDRKRFAFNDSIKVPSARQAVYNDSRAKKGGRFPDNTWILRPQDIPEAFGDREDVWHFPRIAGTFKERAGFHGCQMPDKVMQRIVRACSNPGDVVVDPFAGTGATLIAAKALGRRWVGWEISQEYADGARRRIEDTKAEGDVV